MTEAFICDNARTPIGRYGGALSGIRTDDLAAVPLQALMARNPSVDWERVDDIIYGDANQAGEDMAQRRAHGRPARRHARLRLRPDRQSAEVAPACRPPPPPPARSNATRSPI